MNAVKSVASAVRDRRYSAAGSLEQERRGRCADAPRTPRAQGESGGPNQTLAAIMM